MLANQVYNAVKTNNFSLVVPWCVECVFNFPKKKTKAFSGHSMAYRLWYLTFICALRAQTQRLQTCLGIIFIKSSNTKNCVYNQMEFRLFQYCYEICPILVRNLTILTISLQACRKCPIGNLKREKLSELFVDRSIWKDFAC